MAPQSCYKLKAEVGSFDGNLQVQFQRAIIMHIKCDSVSGIRNRDKKSTVPTTYRTFFCLKQ